MVIFTFHVWGLNRTILAVKVWTSCLTTVLESVLPERVYRKIARLINVGLTAGILMPLASEQISWFGNRNSVDNYNTDCFSSFQSSTLHFLSSHLQTIWSSLLLYSTTLVYSSTFVIFVVYMISFSLDHDDVRKAKQNSSICTKAICMMASLDYNYQNPWRFLFLMLISTIVL